MWYFIIGFVYFLYVSYHMGDYKNKPYHIETFLMCVTVYPILIYTQLLKPDSAIRNDYKRIKRAFKS
jgi:hypothetical protein